MADALKRSEPSLYERDFYAWTQDQAEKLRARAGFDNRGDIDWENAAEEIESLGRSQRSEVRSRILVILVHLLKWRCQPAHRSGSWRGTLIEQRQEIIDLLDENPSLRAYPVGAVDKQYRVARVKASGETDLPEAVFPPECPFTIEEILDPTFYPVASE